MSSRSVSNQSLARALRASRVSLPASIIACLLSSSTCLSVVAVPPAGRAGCRRTAGKASRLAQRLAQRHGAGLGHVQRARSEEHTSELQSLMRNSYAVFCLKKKKE